MHILFGGSDLNSRYMYTSLKKKKGFPTDRPNLKILSPKGQHNNFFYLALPWCDSATPVYTCELLMVYGLSHATVACKIVYKVRLAPGLEIRILKGTHFQGHFKKEA